MSVNGYYSNYLTTTGLNEINANDINSDNINSTNINTNSLYVNGVQITGNSSGSATVNIGTTTTLPPNSNATVTNTGSSTNAILNFGIPAGAQGPQGVQGPQGAQGIAGTNGINGTSFIYRNLYSNSTQYYKNDVVSFNGSSYICLNDCININPDSSTFYWFYLAVKGDTGQQGPKGDKGNTGDEGPRGPKGDNGSDGTSPDIGVIVSAVIGAAGLAGYASLQSQVATLGTTVATLSTTVATQEIEIETLDAKTQYQSVGLDGSNNTTEFLSELIVKTSLADKIKLNPYGTSVFMDDVNIGGNVEISKNLNIDGTQYISESLSVVGDILQSGNHYFKTSGTTGAKIEYSPNLGNLENRGTLSIRAGVINIGNLDQSSSITLNGTVNMRLYNMFGFNVSNGFISQF